MLQPRKTKYRKTHRNRGNLKGKAQRGSKIAFGSYALKAQSRGLVTSRQIEAARQAMVRHVKRNGKIWIRIFPDKPMTQTAAETPMGSGKGNIEFYAAEVKTGRILFEMDGVTEDLARESMRLAAHKLPLKTKFLVN